MRKMTPVISFGEFWEWKGANSLMFGGLEKNGREQFDLSLVCILD